MGEAVLLERGRQQLWEESPGGQDDQVGVSGVVGSTCRVACASRGMGPDQSVGPFKAWILVSNRILSAGPCTSGLPALPLENAPVMRSRNLGKQILV